MPTRNTRTRRATPSRRRTRKAPPAGPIRRIARTARTPLTWALKPVRFAFAASLMGYVVAEAAWNAGPRSWVKAAR